MMEGSLKIGEIEALELGKKYGYPLYVYNGGTIESQYERLVSAFNVDNLRIHYACKAMANINILRLLKNAGSGLDAISIQEVELGLKAGFRPEDIIFTPSGVSLQEIEEGLKLGVKITIDNIPTLEQFGHKYPDVPVCIRVSPHIMAGGNPKISVGHIDSKFGISIHQLPHVHRLIAVTGQKIVGLHMHTGSDILDMEVFLNAAEILFTAAMDFSDLEFLDFGSGFKVAYKEGDLETDIEALGERFSERFNEFCITYGKPLTLIFEPGKFLLSKSGFFLVKVNVVKHTVSSVIAGVDSGFNHLIRPMFYDAYHDITNVSNPGGVVRFYNVTGYICETDTFAYNRKIAEIREKDVLCFHNAGAYCFAMASNYNMRFRPAEVLVYDGRDYLIRRRENMEDLLRNQVEVELERGRLGEGEAR